MNATVFYQSKASGGAFPLFKFLLLILSKDEMANFQYFCNESRLPIQCAIFISSSLPLASFILSSLIIWKAIIIHLNSSPNSSLYFDSANSFSPFFSIVHNCLSLLTLRSSSVHPSSCRSSLARKYQCSAMRTSISLLILSELESLPIFIGNWFNFGSKIT